MARTTSTRHSAIARAALAVLAFLLPLVCAEIVLRVIGPSDELIRFQQLSDAFRGRDEERLIEQVFENDPGVFWRLAPDLRFPEEEWPFFGLVSNGAGLREDHEIPVERADPDEIRILFIGDSTIFGYLLPHHETIVEVVERSLAAQFPEERIECINAGVPGYTLFQGWRFLVDRGMDYQPDLVVAGFGWNDASVWDGLGDEAHYALLQKRRPPGLLAGSLVAQRIWSVAHPTPERSDVLRERLLPREFTTLLHRALALTHEHDSELLVFVGAALLNIQPGVPPSTRSPLQEEQYRFGSSAVFGSEGAPAYVDAVPLVQEMAKRHEPAELFFDRVHPTALVTKQIGELIADTIAPWLRARLQVGARARDRDLRGDD